MHEKSPHDPSAAPRVKAGGALQRRQLFVFGAVGVATTLLSFACKKPPLECNASGTISQRDSMLRATLEYAEATDRPDRTCVKCRQYVVAPPDQCGGCKVVPGPINPVGTCKAFSV